MKTRRLLIPLSIALTSLASARDPSRPLVFTDAQGAERRVETPADWARRRAQILAAMQDVMGPVPPRSEEAPAAKELAREEKGLFDRLRLDIESGDGDVIPAHLYLPKERSDGERRPGILALHQTSPLGKEDAAGIAPSAKHHYARELAERGWVVLAPDYPSFGDAKGYDFAADRYVSGTMKGIANHRRCVDYLVSRPEVDAARLAAIGHSLGGHNAVFIGIFDERLRAVVASCGWNPFHEYYHGDLRGWSSDRYMPRIREAYGADPDRVPFDWYELVAALAPRAFLSISPLRDENFEVSGVMKAIPRAREVYTLLGASERLAVRYPNVEHEFPPRERRAAYDFIERALDFRSPRPETPAIEPSAASEAAAGAFHSAADGRFTGPWDLAELSRPPRADFGAAEGLLRPVFYTSEPFGGRPTRVFAWYTKPEGEGPFPAMLLVHGGGGKAFREWAELWARRGYVALAMDTAGNGPDGKRLEDGGPDQSHEEKFKAFDLGSLREVWTYHAIAAVLRGGSLLAAQKEVDPARIGITGISWGGYLTCIAAGIDPRLKFAVPVYGCGFLHEDSAWLEIFAKLSPAQRALWVACFDPSRYLGGVSCPILFLNGTNDLAYPLGSYRKSWRMVRGAADLSVQVRLPHGHPEGWAPREIAIFADSALRNGEPLPRLGELELDAEKRAASAAVLRGAPVSAELCFTHDLGPWQKREWKTAPAAIAEGRVRADVPGTRPLAFYLLVTDARGAKASTAHLELP